MTVRQFTTGNPYGDMISGEISHLLEKVSNSYDGFNQLKKTERIKGGERVTVEYTYDGDGLRTRKVVKSSKEGYAPKVTNYLYDRQHVILETDEADNVTVRYVRDVNYIGRISGDDQLSYYLYNGHGDVVQTVSAAGEVENQYDYDIFGNPILTVEVYANAIRYAGEFFDVETGLYYLRARYYNPYTGRFISEDSYWGEDVNPLSLNLYTYAYNNPIMYVDPSGHIPIIGDTYNASRDYFKNSKEDEKDRIIKEIDKQKEIWLREENGSGKNRADWTEKQKEAHERANELREKLLELERGNKDVEKIVKERGKEPGVTWEKYKHDRIENKIKRGEAISKEERKEYDRLGTLLREYNREKAMTRYEKGNSQQPVTNQGKYPPPQNIQKLQHAPGVNVTNGPSSAQFVAPAKGQNTVWSAFSSFINGVWVSGSENVSLGVYRAPENYDNEGWYLAGEVVGNTVTTVLGGIEVALGIVDATGGTVVSLTGGGAVVGVPATAAGVAAISHGSAMATKSAGELGQSAKDLYNYISGKGKNTPQGGTGKVNVPSANTKVITTPEVKAPTAIKASDVTKRWEEFLGPNTTNINPRTGQVDPNRIFSADGTRSVRFSNHEMNSYGTPKYHYHEETWTYDAVNDTMTVTNTLQRIK